MARFPRVRKYLAISTSFLLMASLLVGSILSTGARAATKPGGDEPTITIGSAVGTPGEIVEIPVSIANNPGIVAFYVDISYDSSKLKLTEVINGTVLHDPAHSGSLNANPFRLCFDMGLSPVNITANGLVATLRFEILDGGQPSQTEIACTYNPNEIYDIDYNNVYFKVENGLVDIQEAGPPTITVGQNEGIPGAGGLEIPITIENNPGIIAFYVNIAYDAASLALTGVTNGTVLTDPAHSGSLETNPYRLCFDMGLAAGNNTENGVVATLTFAILPSATPGDVPVQISYDPNEIYDYKFTNVFFETSDGLITVLEVAPEITGIEMKANPDKTTYVVGQDLQLAGAEITVFYDNGSTAAFEVSPEMVSGYDKNKIGQQTITVTYEGYTTSFQVTLVPIALAGIAVTTPPSTSQYVEGRSFDPAGMVVTAYYNDDSSEQVTGYTVTPDPLTLGTGFVTIHYADQTTTTPVTVLAKSLLSIEVSVLPFKTTYLIGSAFSAEGGKITLTYDNDTTETLDLDEAMCSGYDMHQPGVQTVLVSYGGMTATFEIRVQDKTLVSISIKTQPSQKSFMVGDSFATNGVITLHYDNGSKEERNITTEMCSGYDMNQPGEQSVTISVDGVTTSYTIQVYAPGTAPRVTVGSVSGMRGDIVDVPVSIANNSGIVSFNISIAYDSSHLKLRGVSEGDVLFGPAHSGSLDTNPYRLRYDMGLSPSNITANGVVATLSFEILSTAAFGDTALTVDYNPNEIFDINYNNVFFEKLHGAITVIDPDTIPFYESFLDGKVKIWADGGVIQQNSVFTVEYIMPPTDSIEGKVDDQFNSFAAILAYYQITLKSADGDLITELPDDLTVAIKLPDGFKSDVGLSIYQEDPNGTLIKMESWLKDGYLFYKTKWLETY